MRCAQWARAEGVDPIGTAGCYDGYLLVERPLPWPRDVSDIVEAPPGVRVQAVVPEGEERRQFLYRRPGREWFSGFEGPGREVLVCGHGTRDVCCGSMGTALGNEVAGTLGDVRLWRTSHTGGHRFAPTAVILPEGTVWAYLDAASLRRVVRREGAPPVELYRGCTGLPSPAAQAVERVALAAVGWPLLDQPRRAVALGAGRVRLETRAGDAWEATVIEGRRMPVPVCGEPAETAPKSDPSWWWRYVPGTDRRSGGVGWTRLVELAPLL